ncbi:hypothetical protein AMJ87_11050 [candidate division WOR_3 bacterium SM23_60]|uniref:tRNA-specific 2-thiouridylase MnmA n=1 Tax=candidate division WOR_3 bacterium SM23_60 TaxID=1703780 RepID=A0A0S8G823_UNCW3|nr:MAG: hypothetical protein AMJ87_11050 [candidate division WOR_3 bacterium SM23_60]
MEKVLVAMSGGVDSATAAAVLKRTGHQVEGAVMVFEGVTDDAIQCAKASAKRLNIPFHCVDLTEEFRSKIIQDFIHEYSQGRTPNPCILCNEGIKFGAFMKIAESRGFTKVATGHYAVIGADRRRLLLKRGRDKNEQSYFLYRLNQQQLARTLLPMGQYTKAQTRALAHEFGLPTAYRTKSQDVCFIPDNDVVAFLRKYVSQRPGPILNKDGHVIGEHQGIIGYTCGQRRGIGLSRSEPYYVTKIDFEQNALYVGDKDDVYHTQLIAADVRFIPYDTLEKNIEVMAKPRYVAPLTKAFVEPLSNNRVKVTFAKAQLAPTPGQSVVFYQGTIVVGGGIIEEVL